MNKILTVYNICQGRDKDNTNHYINSIKSILNQNFESRLVISSCKNSTESLNKLRNEFGDKINIIYFDDIYTVNITFNKAVQEFVKKFGNFEGYMFIDSGVTLTDSNVIHSVSELMDEKIYSMVTVQVDQDTGFPEWLGFDFVRGDNYIIPVGRTCNCHCQLFSNELFETYNKKILPDIFMAYCTESVLSFLNAAIKKKWVIIKDIIVSHIPQLDGSSIYFRRESEKFGNSWNNLLFDRSVFDFMHDEEAIHVGLGYEELRNIMMHKKEMYDENGFSLDPERLRKVILKISIFKRTRT